MNDITKKIKEFSDTIETMKKIEDQTKDIGFDWSLLLQERPKIHLAWLIASIVFFALNFIGIIIAGQKNQDLYIILFSTGLLSATWVTCCIHLRFDNNVITGGVSFMLIVTLFVAGRVITPSEGANKILDKVSKEIKINKDI